MTDPVGTAADIEQGQAGQRGGGRVFGAIRLRGKTCLDGGQFLLQGAFAALQRLALLALAAEIAGRPRQTLLEGGAPVRLRPQPVLQAGDQIGQGGLLGRVVVLHRLVGDAAGQQVAQLADLEVARG